VDPDTLAGRLTAAGSPRPWVEDVPAAADDAAAERRRSTELARPVAGLRCVLLRYADGPVDLVLVADRAAVDRSGLRRLAAAALGDPTGALGDPTGALGDPTEADRGAPNGPVPVVAAPPPDWGLGAGRGERVGTHQLDLPDGGDEASWLAALAATLRCYDPEAASIVIGTDRGPGEVSVAAERTLGELCRQPLAPVDRPVLAGLQFASEDTGGEYVPCLEPPFPLTVSVLRGPGGWRLRCDYRPSHVAPAIAAAFATHLAHVHGQVRHAPETPLAEVAVLDERERTRVAALGRPPAAPASAPVCVPEAFRRVAAATPDAVALCDGAVRLTYRELDERSDRLAGGLRALRVRDGDRVGVCLERSAELVVTLLGVLKAGATYVPTDPAYPAERLAYTARDAELGVVVTRLPEFPQDPAHRTVTPDALIDAAPPGAPSTAVTPDHPAYVIYTSGSTGRPKGVVVPHRNVLSLLDATRDEYQLGAGDVWTLFHSSAFDFSVWEIWGCLLTGGRLVVVPYFVSRDPERFRDLLRAEGVTVLSQTPSAFAQLLDVDHADLAVRLVVFGGEPLDARMLLPWFDRHPEPVCRMVNMFGITETTVHVTAQTVTRTLALVGSRAVGPALPGWHVYVMDPAGRLVPPGVAGEIYVGGAGVALHYLNQRELTAQRFLPDPFTGGRMYRSGDRGRLRPDGVLEHLGRIDSQVKVRGFRIELDEIRSVLLEDPDVRAAAVLVRRDDPTDAATARIDAYVVLAGGDTGNVRKRAAGILPEYMVPTTVTALDALPLTTNGKLDPARLPVPVPAAGPPPDGPYTDDDGLAETLREVWGTVLGVPVGLDDDFFELGGNSLFAVRIGAAMRARGLPHLRLRELYRYPTIRAVVTAIGNERADMAPV
jgi:amino acid adenylation domain-containing protein